MVLYFTLLSIVTLNLPILMVFTTRHLSKEIQHARAQRNSKPIDIFVEKRHFGL